MLVYLKGSKDRKSWNIFKKSKHGNGEVQILVGGSKDSADQHTVEMTDRRWNKNEVSCGIVGCQKHYYYYF